MMRPRTPKENVTPLHIFSQGRLRLLNPSAVNCTHLCPVSDMTVSVCGVHCVIFNPAHRTKPVAEEPFLEVII